MNWISENKITIVGLGLIGGSYAKALKRLGYTVYAIDTNESSLKYAENHKIIDKGFTDVETSKINESDAVIFALYPKVFINWIDTYQKYFKKGAYITDVTGVKSSIVYEIQGKLRDDVEFIAAHPMAGREVYGVENSDDRIFRDANYIVVPTDKNTSDAVLWCKQLGQILGFNKISVLSPTEHDKMIGFVSQLTHCIAVALMTSSDNTHLVDYTGDSFRDLTRIANINDSMWSELFMMNKEPLLYEMEKFSNEFSEIKDMIKNDDVDGLRKKMKLSTLRRSYFDK